MKILIINHFPLVGSGSGTYTENIAIHLHKLGHEVTIVLPENSTDYSAPEGVTLHPVFFTDKEQIEGALPFNFPCFTTHPRSTTTFADLTPVELENYLKAFKSAIEEEIETFGPDIIHAQHIWLLSYLGTQTGIPTVMTAHGTDLMGYQKWPQFHHLAQEAVKQAKGILTISKDTNQLVIDTFPQSKRKTHLMENGYNTSVFYPENTSREKVFHNHPFVPKKHFVMFAGKMTQFKGIDVLLDAASIYEKQLQYNVTTCIAGDGSLFETLKAQSKQLNLRDTHFLGHTPHERLRALYSVADVSVVPSRREAFGLVAIEALACGTPVVATNEGGLPDFINNKVGALVPVDNPQKLAEAIVNELTLKEPNKAKKRKYCATYAKENYSQDEKTQKLISFYQDCLKD